MKSQIRPEAFPLATLQDFPLSSGSRIGFWPHPIRPGFYGEQWQGDIFLASDHRPSVYALGQALSGKPAMVLAVRAGGFPVEQSAAYQLISPETILSALAQIPADTPAGKLLTPLSLAHSLGWSSGTTIERWKVTLLPDAPEQADVAWNSANPISHPKRGAVLERLLGAVKIWMGQVLLLTLPALIFGWQAALWIFSCTALSAILLAVLWIWLPGNGWARGLLTGLIIAAMIFGLFQFNIIPSPNGTILPLVGAWICCTWMGGILSGAKN